MRPAVPGRMPLAIGVSAVVGELYLAAKPHGIVDDVDVSEDAVCLRLDAARNVDAPLKQRPLVVACQELDVRHERGALPRRQRLAGLHCVDHEHELGELELTPDKRVLHRVPLVGADVAAELPEHLDVAVDALALRFDVELLQPLYDLPHRQLVLGVGLLLEDLLHVEGLELGLVVVRHGTTTASDTPNCRTNSISSFYCKPGVSDIRGVP